MSAFSEKHPHGTRSTVSPAPTFDLPPPPIPSCRFRIGEDGEAGIWQFPNLRLLSFYVIGKGPMAPMVLPSGRADNIGMAQYALGALIADACLKLWHPWADEAGEHLAVENPFDDIETVIDVLLPVSPRACFIRTAFLCRLAEFINVMLHQPDRLPAIITAIDTLTNARLTKRARAILSTGIDPGSADLWVSNVARLPGNFHHE